MHRGSPGRRRRRSGSRQRAGIQSLRWIKVRRPIAPEPPPAALRTATPPRLRARSAGVSGGSRYAEGGRNPQRNRFEIAHLAEFALRPVLDPHRPACEEIQILGDRPDGGSFGIPARWRCWRARLHRTRQLRVFSRAG